MSVMSLDKLTDSAFYKESKERQAKERYRVLSARSWLESLPPSTVDEIDDFSDVVVNAAIEAAETEFGESWFGGCDFNR